MQQSSELYVNARNVFATEDGQKLMEALRKRTIERPTFPAPTGDGQSIALMMALREGENNICRWLESLANPNKIGANKTGTNKTNQQNNEVTS